MGLPYRVQQFYRSIFQGPPRDEAAIVEPHLPPELSTLFFQMSDADRAHSIRVLSDLHENGERDPDLLAAALLHDVGKCRSPINSIERTLAVLAERWMPSRVDAWSHGEPVGWRKPFVVSRHHPSWGADMVQQAGGSETLAKLILAHQSTMGTGDQKTDDLLLKLQQADATN
jgi:putative nucleotidyltransferase with HDIG domain